MSYIPRSSMSGSGVPGAIPKTIRKKHTFRVFGLIATIMILGSSLSLVATYLYKIYSLDRLENAKQALVDISSADVSRDIADLEAFDKKIKTAQTLINNHLAPSNIFDALEESTKGTVQILSFKYTYDPGFQALLEFNAGTNNFVSVASQNEVIAQSTLFSEYVVESITASLGTGQQAVQRIPVTFAVRGSLEKRALQYNNATSNGIPAVQIEQFGEFDSEESSNDTSDTDDSLDNI